VDRLVLIGQYYSSSGKAYRSSGGAYVVSRDNFGGLVASVAGSP
jgi:hypothetical protein